MGIKVDFSGVSNFEPLPTGVYPCRIESVELKESKKGPFDNLNWIMIVTDGEYADRKLFLTTTLKPEGLFKLKELLEAFGEEVRLEELNLEPEVYIGSEILVGVETSTYEGKPTNNITKLEAIS